MMRLELLYIIPVMAFATFGYILIKRGSDAMLTQCTGIACIMFAGNLIMRMYV